MTYQIGQCVRDTKWNGTYTGTIVNIEGDDLFVQWHGTCVEDQLSPEDVEPAPDVTNPSDNGLRLMTFWSDTLGRNVTIPEN